MGSNKKSILFVGALCSLVLFGYQNCSKITFKMEDEGYRRAGLLEDENGRPIPYYQSFEIGEESIQYPDLKMIFVLDNSKSMDANRVNFKEAFKSLFNDENKKILNPFNTTIYITTTAQLSMPDTSKLNQLPSRSPASLKAENYSNLFSQRSPVVTGSLPGDIFGIYHLSGVDANGIQQHSFMPASLLGITSDNNGGSKILTTLNKAPFQDPTDMIKDFESRVALLQWDDGAWNSSNQDAKTQVVDKESGLCAVSRILKHPDGILQKGDLLSVAIFSDEDDKDSNGQGNEKNCLDNIYVAPKSESLTTVKCQRDATQLTYDQYKPDCQISYTTSNKCDVTYSQTTNAAAYCNVKYAPVVASSCPVSFQTIATAAKCVVNYKEGFKFTLYGNKISTDVTVPSSGFNDGYFGLKLSSGSLTGIATQNFAGRISDCRSKIVSLVESSGQGSKLSNSDIAVIDTNLASGVLKCTVKSAAFQTASTVYNFVDYNDVNYTSNLTTKTKSACSNFSKLNDKVGSQALDIELDGSCSIDAINTVANKDVALVNSTYSIKSNCESFFTANPLLVSTTSGPSYTGSVLGTVISKTAKGLNAGDCDNAAADKAVIMNKLRTSGVVSGGLTDDQVFNFAITGSFVAAAYETNSANYQSSNQSIADKVSCESLTDTTKLPALKISKCTLGGDCLIDGSKTNGTKFVAASSTTTNNLVKTFFGTTSTLDNNGCVNKTATSVSSFCSSAGINCSASAVFKVGGSGQTTISVADSASCDKSKIANFTTTYCAGEGTSGACYVSAKTTVNLLGSAVSLSGQKTSNFSGVFDCNSTCTNAGNFCATSGGIFNGSVSQYLNTKGQQCVSATTVKENQSPAENPILSSQLPSPISQYACKQAAQGFVAVGTADAGTKSGDPSIDYVYVSESDDGQLISFNDFIVDQSKNLLGSAFQPIVNVFSLDSSFGDAINTNGQSSFGLNYQKLADTFKGSKYSVFKSDYGMALKSLGNVIQQKLARSAKIALKDANKQQIRKVWLTRKGESEIELDSTEWGASGSSLTINESVSLNLGDQVRVEFW